MLRLQLNARLAQGFDMLPDRHTADADRLPKRFTRVVFTIREELQQLPT
jgi:hypothetical protein